MLHAAEKTEDPLIAVLDEQILSLARNLGDKFRYEIAHSSAVEMLSLKLFVALFFLFVLQS